MQFFSFIFVTTKTDILDALNDLKIDLIAYLDFFDM